jgi:hypothetical protein
MFLTYRKSESFLTNLSASSLLVGHSPKDGHELAIGHAPQSSFLPRHILRPVQVTALHY